ncbi:acyltransferase family protein [Microbulbifer aggregans]|uniref:acyltransferase family protein n=1 Tax=Microbulbifer aggregans TaxID=1769779 RepID=UPI001CFCC432|nr:acyltransferase family protein [Microbulbifer aggregans]
MYLREVQGLRVVAALLVAVYHIWFQKVSGGVDAFFVISGFFIYRTLLKHERVAWSNVLGYYKKTFSRIAPSASVVILATCAGYLLIGMESKWSVQIRSAIAAIFFVENWWLSSSSVDYLAQGEVPSPFQQMWALSVQMQIYILMPIVLLFLSAFDSRLNFKKKAILPLLIVLFVASFIYAMVATYENQPKAYFDTGARLWEFLTGMILAACFTKVRIPQNLARVLGYSCVFVFVFFAAVIPVSEQFPGVPALIPVISTAGIIVAAGNSASLGFLNSRSMQWLGNLSFTFYLWHWPLLTAYWQVTGYSEVGVVPGIGIIVVSGVLAYLTYTIVEKPFRLSSVVNGNFVPALASCVVVMIPAVIMVGVWGGQYISVKGAASKDVKILLNGGVPEHVVPATVIAKSDVPQGYKNGCNQRWGMAEVIECVFGNENGSNEVVLVGGSHSLHWLPALQEIAKVDRTVKIIAMTKGNCPLTRSGALLALGEESVCLEWNRKVIARINELKPDAVFTLLTSTRVNDEGVTEYIPEGFYDAWGDIPNIPIIAVRDTPRSDFDFVLCVDRYGPYSERCSVDKRQKLDSKLGALIGTGNPGLLGLPDNVYPIDLTNSVCESDSCLAVQNGIMKFRDRAHLTATYARYLAPEVHEKIKKTGVFSG